MNKQAETSGVKLPEEVDRTRDNQENEIEAEQESAAAMDADVPQPADEDTIE